VLASTAYLLFYVKRSLDYKPLVKPTYVITRETEALKEKEREREKEMKLSQEIDEELMSIL
jgi:ubiquitin carboxyl-terminal hydrolase 22/27/51